MTKAQRWVPATHLSTLHDMFKRHYPKHLPEPGIEAPRRAGYEFRCVWKFRDGGWAHLDIDLNLMTGDWEDTDYDEEDHQERTLGLTSKKDWAWLAERVRRRNVAAVVDGWREATPDMLIRAAITADTSYDVKAVAEIRRRLEDAWEAKLEQDALCAADELRQAGEGLTNPDRSPCATKGCGKPRFFFIAEDWNGAPTWASYCYCFDCLLSADESETWNRNSWYHVIVPCADIVTCQPRLNTTPPDWLCGGCSREMDELDYEITRG